MDNFDLKKYLAEGRLEKEMGDDRPPERLKLDPDYDKGGKYYSEEGAEAFRIQPFKLNKIEYTKDQAVRQGKYIVGLKGEELKKFISDYMAAWKEDKGDTPEGKTFKENMYIDDEEFEMEMGRSKKDSLKKEMMMHVDQLMDGNIDMIDFMNVVEEIMLDVKIAAKDEELNKREN